MSWWVYLHCPTCKQALPVESHTGGGTIAIGGESTATMNITYNYGGHFAGALGYEGHFAEYLTGKTGAEMVEALENAVEALGTDIDPDYWKPTPGNAGRSLAILLNWAKQHPSGVFEVH